MSQLSSSCQKPQARRPFPALSTLPWFGIRFILAKSPKLLEEVIESTDSRVNEPHIAYGANPHFKLGSGLEAGRHNGASLRSGIGGGVLLRRILETSFTSEYLKEQPNVLGHWDYDTLAYVLMSYLRLQIYARSNHIEESPEVHFKKESIIPPSVKARIHLTLSISI